MIILLHIFRRKTARKEMRFPPHHPKGAHDQDGLSLLMVTLDLTEVPFVSLPSWKVIPFLFFPYYTPWKEDIMNSPRLRSGELCSFLRTSV